MAITLHYHSDKMAWTVTQISTISGNNIQEQTNRPLVCENSKSVWPRPEGREYWAPVGGFHASTRMGLWEGLKRQPTNIGDQGIVSKGTAKVITDIIDITDITYITSPSRAQVPQW
jgi:hypothetical protein